MSNEYLDWRRDKLETYKNICRKFILHSINFEDFLILHEYLKSNVYKLSKEERTRLSNTLYNTSMLMSKLKTEEEDYLEEYQQEFEDIIDQLNKIDVKFKIYDFNFTEIGNAIVCIMYKKKLSYEVLKKVVGDYYNEIMYRYSYNVPSSVLMSLSYFLGVDYIFFAKYSFNSTKYISEYYNDLIEKQMCEERVKYNKLK